MSDLLTRQRRSLIAERLVREGRVVAGPLAREFGVSEDTVRRDLREMAAAGLCERVYGGALPPPAPASASLPLAERAARARGLKAALGEAAAALVPEGATLFVDAGSTNLAVVEALARARRSLTLLTNAPAVALAAGDGGTMSVVLIGGRLDASTGACLGARALRDLEGLVPDTVILGACGVDPDAGVSAVDFEDAEFKARLGGRARRVMVVAGADKLGTVAPFPVLAAAKLADLVTQGGADGNLLARFEANGTRVTRVDAPNTL